MYNQGKNPYEVHYLGLGTKLKDMLDQLKSGFRLPLPTSMPKEVGALATRCLTRAPERPTMSDLVNALKNYHAGQVLP